MPFRIASVSSNNIYVATCFFTEHSHLCILAFFLSDRSEQRRSNDMAYRMAGLRFGHSLKSLAHFFRKLEVVAHSKNWEALGIGHASR